VGDEVADLHGGGELGDQRSVEHVPLFQDRKVIA
jgi:hypothetical protein